MGGIAIEVFSYTSTLQSYLAFADSLAITLG